MSTIRKQYDEEFKKNAVKLSYASSKSTREVARDLGISDGMLGSQHISGRKIKQWSGSVRSREEEPLKRRVPDKLFFLTSRLSIIAIESKKALAGLLLFNGSSSLGPMPPDHCLIFCPLKC